jgi:surface antigen
MDGPLGHVSLVKQVYPDSSIDVTEMNYSGYDVIDQRHIPAYGSPLVGFIYLRQGETLY